ncbi:MAG: 5-formyltetrahydrofolate cyclo-ligase [Candidatus Omnitrophica bacterium]|nr:5-formyltetrahydrofolate cyclo-ligase [Candidatus Omnitrophota bacterium]
MEFVQKQTLRQKLLELLKTQKEEIRLKKSSLIQDKLFKTSEFKKAEIVMFYCSFDGEVETVSMMKQAKKIGKKIAVPVTIREEKRIIPSLVNNLDHELIEGPYGIKQPKKTSQKSVSTDDLDLVVVPGVAFDRHNNRLGRGEGYYDRFLKLLPPTTPTIGLAFDFQMVDALPELQAHDIPVSLVLTNSV